MLRVTRCVRRMAGSQMRTVAPPPITSQMGMTTPELAETRGAVIASAQPALQTPP